MHDAIVIGSGPNGLVAAATLAVHGWRVLVLEAQRRPGGAVYSEPLTLPGYLHDVGAAFFPFAEHSPAFRFLDLASAGLRWANAPWESSHPAPDGTCVSISRDRRRSRESLGADGPAWDRLAAWQAAMGPRLAEALLAPLPGLHAAWKLGPTHLLRLGLWGGLPTAWLSRRLFRTEAARRVLPGLALHVDLGPSDLAGAGLGLVLGLLAAGTGFCVPLGGARAITQALIHRLESAGGSLLLGCRATGIDRCKDQLLVRTANGEIFTAGRAVLADVGPRALYFHLLRRSSMSELLLSSVRGFRYGWGTFKMDWALAGPVPWAAPQAREAAVIHAGDSIADLETFTKTVRAGELPTNPYLVIGQQSLVDPSRAPTGRHTLWAYSHVPSTVSGGWTEHRQAFAERVELRIEALAPGFRRLILGRAIHSPADLEQMDENLVGGDLGGGSAHWNHQLFLRPSPLAFRYRTPVRGVYHCSASTHPGAGVHGACGFNAAMAALQDQPRRRQFLGSSTRS